MAVNPTASRVRPSMCSSAAMLYAASALCWGSPSMARWNARRAPSKSPSPCSRSAVANADDDGSAAAGSWSSSAAALVVAAAVGVSAVVAALLLPSSSAMPATARLRVKAAPLDAGSSGAHLDRNRAATSLDWRASTWLLGWWAMNWLRLGPKGAWNWVMEVARAIMWNVSDKRYS